jgi:Cu+-exporting ATPase
VSKINVCENDKAEIRSMPQIITDLKCYHCGDECKTSGIHVAEKIFCCDGCKLVYQLLNENGLCTYYDLNTNPGISQKETVRLNKFVFLDQPEIIQKLISFTDGRQTHITFYLPQMHCSSCLWLLENLHRIRRGIISSKVNFVKREAFIIFDNNTVTLRQIVETLASIGYEPYISLNDLTSVKWKENNKSQLYKLGISGFCFANIMMMSLPEYFSGGGHVEETLSTFFRVIIVTLSLPVFFYCASGFFKTAWEGIKNFHLNIDAPIALAILITFLRSLYELFSRTGPGYLDSMSGIVFFMLLGRLLQDKTFHSISFDRDYRSFFPIAVSVRKEDAFIPVPVDQVKPGDIFQIFNNEIIAVDSIVSKGKAQIDYSFVSGESIPVFTKPGELIYAGGRQTDGRLELVAAKEISQSYLTNLWNQEIFKTKKQNEESFINKLGNYFTLIVLAIAFAAGGYWFYQGEITRMLNTLTTVLIVACPCALLLSSSFTNGNVLRILGMNKFYLRHASVIEELSKATHIVFDKTGTLTEQHALKVEYSGDLLSQYDKIKIVSLLNNSAHPLSRAVMAYLNVSGNARFVSFKEIPGKGIEGWIEDEYFKIGSSQFVTGTERGRYYATEVYLSIDNCKIGVFRISNIYRDGFSNLMKRLKEHYTISIISGDNNAECETLRKELGEETEILFNCKPAEKLEYIKGLQEKNNKVIMIGDGLNDAGALKQSDVGITLTENCNNFTPSCDGILESSTFKKLEVFIRFCSTAQRIILASFFLSFLYNAIGMYFAVQGILSPLIAAILMPSSTLTIILFTYGLSEFYAQKYSLKKS